METGKTLVILKGETDGLGLCVEATGRNGRILKRDYVKVLMVYNLILKYGSMEQVPMNLKFRLSFTSPQLAYGYFDLKQKEQEVIWDDSNIWLVEKISGIRATLIYSKVEKWSLFSRDINDDTYLWIDYSEKVFEGVIDDLESNGGFDVEIQLGNQGVKGRLREMNYEVVSDFQAVSALFMLDEEVLTQIKKEYPGLFKFKLIDIYFWVADARKHPYKEREKRFEGCIGTLMKAGIKIERPQYCKDPILKKAFHESIIKEGGEGTIATFAENSCILTGQRKKDGMVKIKRSVFPLLLEPDALTDMVDGWVSKIVKRDAETDLIHTIEVSTMKESGEVIRVALCEGIPLSIRQSGMLKEGCVVELSGTCWKEGLITDAIVERVRFDKEKSSCILNC